MGLSPGPSAGSGASAWVDESTDGVKLAASRTKLWDALLAAQILLDGGIYLSSSGDGIDLSPDPSFPVDITSGTGLVLPVQTSDPGTPVNGQLLHRSDLNLLRARLDGKWVSIPWRAASGQSQILSGNTSITVTHGAGFDPVTARGVLVWPTNNPTNDPGWFWVSNVGATTFDINVRADPGASGAFFAWWVVPQ